MMAGSEEANDDIANKSFHHTIVPGTPPSAEQLIAASSGAPQPQKGSDMHEILMERARHKAHLETTLGDSKQFFDYKNSSVAGVSGDKDIRRELTSRSRQERIEREKRFGHKKRHGARRHENTPSINERQRFNTTGTADPASPPTDTRQEFNTKPPEARQTFREPPTRGYNPYS